MSEKVVICANGCGKVSKDTRNWKTCDCENRSYYLGTPDIRVYTCLHCLNQYSLEHRKRLNVCCNTTLEEFQIKFQPDLKTCSNIRNKFELQSISYILDNDMKFIEKVTKSLEQDDSLVSASEELLQHVEKAKKLCLLCSVLPDCMEKHKFDTLIAQNFNKKRYEAELYKSLYDKVVDESDVGTFSKIKFFEKLNDMITKKGESNIEIDEVYVKIENS